MTEKKTVAVFDFDGTLTYFDTFFYFILFSHGYWGTLYRGVDLIPQMLGYSMGYVLRKNMKEHILTAYFKGSSLKEFKEKAQSFFDQRQWLFKPKMVQELKRCKERGDLVVIVSANLDPLMQEVKRVLPVDHVLATRMDVDEQGLITGRVAGENCWGEEKVKRLLELLGERSQYTIIAYGDSQGDKQLLENADKAYWV